MITSTIPTEGLVAALAEHSSGFAEAAGSTDFAAPVVHCPGWSVTDLVHHLTDVQWFWATIVDEHASAPPPEDDPRRPPRLTDAVPAISAFRVAADRLAATLVAADQDATCWTWAPTRQDVGFVTRHQVQEAAVHHWDAANAAGLTWSMDPVIAADSVSEFLEFSVSSDEDLASKGDPLDGRFRLRASDTGDVWEVSPGSATLAVAVAHRRLADPGTDPTAGTSGDQADGEITAPAGDLLLWLYGRTSVTTDDVPADLLARFRKLAFTD